MSDQPDASPNAKTNSDNQNKPKLIGVDKTPSDSQSEEDTDFFNAIEGGKSPVSGRVWSRIVLQTATVIVFIDDGGQIRIETDVEYGDYPVGVISIWPDVKIAESRPLRNLEKADRDTYLILVARALAEVAEKDGNEQSGTGGFEKQRLEGATRMIREAENFRAGRLAEVSRRWTLCSSAMWCLLWLSLALAAWLSDDIVAKCLGPNAPIAINCIAFGVFGAFVSVCLRLGRINASPESGKLLHILESCVRMIIGGAAGLAVYLAVRTGIMLKDIATPSTQVLLLYLVALVGGLSERALHSLAAQVPGGLAKDLDKNDGPNAP